MPSPDAMRRATEITKEFGYDGPVEPWTRILAEHIDAANPPPQSLFPVPEWAVGATNEILAGWIDGIHLRMFRRQLIEEHGGTYDGLDADASRKTREFLARNIILLMPKGTPAPESKAIPDWAIAAAKDIIEAEGDGTLFRKIRSEIKAARLAADPGAHMVGLDTEATQETCRRLAQMILARMPKEAAMRHLPGRPYPEA